MTRTRHILMTLLATVCFAAATAEPKIPKTGPA